MGGSDSSVEKKGKNPLSKKKRSKVDKKYDMRKNDKSSAEGKSLDEKDERVSQYSPLQKRSDLQHNPELPLLPCQMIHDTDEREYSKAKFLNEGYLKQYKGKRPQGQNMKKENLAHEENIRELKEGNKNNQGKSHIEDDKESRILSENQKIANKIDSRIEVIQLFD